MLYDVVMIINIQEEQAMLIVECPGCGRERKIGNPPESVKKAVEEGRPLFCNLVCKTRYNLREGEFAQLTVQQEEVHSGEGR